MNIKTHGDTPNFLGCGWVMEENIDVKLWLGD